MLLSPLPSLQLRIGPAPVLRPVDKLSCVRIGSARYSVPMALIGTSVEVLAGSGRVLIVDTHTGQVVADDGAVVEERGSSTPSIPCCITPDVKPSGTANPGRPEPEDRRRRRRDRLAGRAFVAYYCGGFVAGRMARFNGLTQGLAVWLWAVVIAAVVAILAAVAGSKYDVLNKLNSFPRIPVSEGNLTTGGTIVVVVVALGSLAGALLGGLAAMRFHRRVDKAGLGR